MVGKLFARNYARLGWDKVAGESAGDESLRGIVLSKTLYAENADAKAKASQIFAAHKENLAGIPADIRPIVLNNEINNVSNNSIRIEAFYYFRGILYHLFTINIVFLHNFNG